jgi:hypothetical protein
MDKDKTILLGEIRYAERLCLRTARLYRHIQATSVFLSVIGGSAVISSASGNLPAWVPVAGGAMLAIFGAMNLAMRPADKAVANEVDAKRYAKLRTSAQSMSASELQTALEAARESDVQEVESLREVAYNDLVREIGREDESIPLRMHQKLLSALA